MKKSLLSFLFGCCLTIIFAFNIDSFKPNYSTAEVSKIDEILVFSDCKPVMPYDILGTVNLGFVSGTQYETIRKNLIKRAKKSYPTADGIILNLNKNGLDNCNVIKFK
jgi:hypothetical protein